MKSLKKKTILALSSTLLFGALIGIGSAKEALGVNATGETKTGTINLGTDIGFSSWTSSYAARTGSATAFAENDITISFSKANKQSGTITDCPVTKDSDNSISITGAAFKSVTFTFKQWGTKNPSLTFGYDTTEVGSVTTFTETYTVTIPEGTIASSVYFNNTNSSQVGYVSIAYEAYTIDAADQKYNVSFSANGGTFVDGFTSTIKTQVGEKTTGTLPTESDLALTADSTTNVKATKLTGWTDGTNTYNPGDPYEVEAATTFTAVYEVAKDYFTIEEALEIGEKAGTAYTTYKYRILGEVTETGIGGYNSNFYITNGTTTIYSYYSDDDAAVGDVVVLRGKLGAYNGTPQIKNASVDNLSTSALQTDTMQSLLLTGHDDGTFTAGTRFAVTIPADLVSNYEDLVNGFGFEVSIDGTTYVDVEVTMANVVLDGTGTASYGLVINNIPEANYATDIKAKAYVKMNGIKVYFGEVGYSVADMVAAYAANPDGLTAEQVQLLTDFAASYAA